MHESRMRSALTVAVACAVIAITALVYLHPWSRPAAPTPTRLAMPSAAPTIVDLEVVSGRVAWVITRPPGSGPLVLATSDSGRTWHRVELPASAAAEAKLGLQAIDQQHLVAHLTGGLLTTADGGRTWRAVPLPPGQRYGGGARFVDPMRGWYQDLSVDAGGAGQRTAMWWTVDGGVTWTELWRVDAQHPSAAGLTLDGTKLVLGFRDPSHGWLAVQRGDAGSVLATVDGGRSWSPIDLPVGEPAVADSLQVLGDGTIVLLERTRSGWVALASRGGVWEGPRPVPIAPPGPDGETNRPAFTDHDHWAVADGGRMLVTADAGRTWRPAAVSLPDGVTMLRDLWLLPGGQGWAIAADAIGTRVVLSTRDGGRRWSRSGP